MKKGKKPKYFEVGLITSDEKEVTKKMTTTDVYGLITRLNNDKDNLITVILKKKPKQKSING